MATATKTKAVERRATSDKRPRASAKYIRISPDKVRIVLNIIRGKGYSEAISILKNTPKIASEVLIKIMDSAASNAENNLNMSKNSLVVAECFADGGPILKRVMPRARGSAARINKRTSHITIILDDAKNI